MFCKNNMIKIYTILIISFLHVGCATNRTLGDLPALDQEFNLSLDDLKHKYPDISAYNEYLGHCTDIDEFISKLGEPSRIEKEYFQLPLLSIPLGVSAGGPGGAAVIVIAYAMFPLQPKNYYWVRGKYVIRARVLSDFTCGYNDRVHMFEWNEPI